MTPEEYEEVCKQYEDSIIEAKSMWIDLEREYQTFRHLECFRDKIEIVKGAMGNLEFKYDLITLGKKLMTYRIKREDR